jgi:AraC family transcriptional regulator
MTLNVKQMAIASVPIVLPQGTESKLAFRGLSSSRLIAAEISYGVKTTENPPKPLSPRCIWQEAYAIGVNLRDERSEILLDGKSYSNPTRRGETRLLYLSGLAHIDFASSRHSQEVILQQSFMREIADDLEVPYVTHLGRGLYHMADDAALRRLALRIYPYFDAPETIDPLFADHYMWSLGIYLCASYGDLATRRPVKGGLSSWQERLAKDVIETSLVGGIGLTELASLCGLRTSQFAHGFRRSTGMAPYQWLQQRRVARAKYLLARSHRASLADIAIACGFADQSHLTRSFARVAGTTPGAWRNAIQKA